MYTDRSNNKSQKLLASFIVILSVVFVTVGVSAYSDKHKSAQTSVSTQTTTSQSTRSSTGSSSTGTPAGSSSATYKDGTYTATRDYRTPGGGEGITVQLTVQGDTVTSSSVEHQTDNHESTEYQSAFSESYKSFVIGKKLSDISLPRVSGSSLTSKGFNEALQQIRSQAQAA